MEDLVVHYDGSVRNAIGEIVEFIYGGDGLDPVFMEIKDRPVDLKRQLLHMRAMNPFRGEDSLAGNQLVPTADRILATNEFNDSRQDFRKECLSFLKNVGEQMDATHMRYQECDPVAKEIDRTTEGHVRSFLQAVSLSLTMYFFYALCILSTF